MSTTRNTLHPRGLFFWLSSPVKQVSARLLALTVVLLLSLLVVGCESDSEVENDDTPAPQAVQVQPVEVGSIARTIDYVGTVKPLHQVEINARINATVIDVDVNEGDRVDRGDALLEMESEELVAQLRRLAAGVQRAKLDYEYQCGVSEAERTLADEGVVAELNAGASETRCRTSEQALAAERAALQEGQQRREYLQEDAPFSGVVLQRMAEPGEHVGPGQPLFSIGSRQLDIRVMVTEHDVARGIEVRQQVTLRSELGEHASRVTRVAPLAEGAGRTIEARVALPELWQQRMRTGMSVDAAFVLEKSEQTIIVPTDAVVDTADGQAVFVVRGDRVKEAAVETGVRTGGRTEIVGAFDDGDRVVVSKPRRLRDGQLVYPVQTGEQK